MMGKKMWLSKGAVMISVNTGTSKICSGEEVEVLGVMNERPGDSIVTTTGGMVCAVMTSKLQKVADNANAPWCRDDARRVAAEVTYIVVRMAQDLQRSKRSILFAIRKEVDQQISEN